MTSVSIVPYHEILLLWVACLMALYTFFQKRYVSASIWPLALGPSVLYPVRSGGCLPVFALATWRRGRPLWQSALFFGWAPLFWLGFRRRLFAASSDTAP
jgi:hypothetical protein